MATMINLDTSRIQTIHNELVSLDSSLVSNALPELQGTVGNISNNVQNDKMHGIITRIDSQISSISTALKSDLNRLEEFLETQISSYNTSNQNATQRVDAVVNRMDNYATVNGIGASVGAAVGSAAGAVASAATNTVNAANAAVEQAPLEKEELGFWGQIGRDYADDWDFSNVDGLFSGIGAVGKGLIGNVGATVNAACEMVGAAWNWIFG